MHFTSRQNIVIAAILFIIITTFLPAGCGKEEPEGSGSGLPIDEVSQKAALMKLYEATNGDSWMNNLNWGSDRPLQEWFGIRTVDGHVTEIVLPGNHLEGTLPDELFELAYLERLVLDSPRHHNTYDDSSMEDWNLISGDLNELGPKIARLTNLKELNFRGLVNITCGDIPDEIWMSQIEKIDLSQVPIKGCITPAIGNATNLRYLDICRNNRKTDLHGTIPAEITKLKHLEDIQLWGNSHLTGPVPENIGDMTSLNVINVNMCALSGTIPESLFKLKNLVRFDAACNFLEGEFDLNRLNEFPELDMFAIDGNMQGVGTAPDFIRSVWFNNNGYFYHYSYGKLITCEEQVYFNTPEMLAERLAE